MTARRIYLLACLLIASACCRADSNTTVALTPAEYRVELDRLLAVANRLNTAGTTPEGLQNLPDTWRVRSDQNEFDISTEGLQRDVRRYEKDRSVANVSAIRRRLQALRDDLDGYEKAPAEPSAKRSALNSILARPEFRNVSGPNWFDRLKQQLLLFVIHVLQRLFRSSAIPTISRYFIYILMALALAALAYVVYRNLRMGSKFDTVVPKDIPVSAKEWTIWLTEARAAAAKGEWRDAIHLAYWAGISYLERQGMWKPDRARTPREYLRLLASSSEHRETLNSLTRIFELAWYAKRDASEGTFSQTLKQLEKLGCR
jgi:hypothetical protein